MPRSSASPAETFPKSVRLRKRAEFLEVQRSGRKVHAAHFLLLLAPPMGSRTRVGVTVTSKVGNAVVRNRLKRWVREAVRKQLAGLPAGRLVLIAKGSAAQVEHGAIDQDLSRLFSRLREGST